MCKIRIECASRVCRTSSWWPLPWQQQDPRACIHATVELLAQNVQKPVQSWILRHVTALCTCEQGFVGPDCSTRSCPSNCSARGSCLDGQCLCSPGWTGLTCDFRACPEDCLSRGACLNGTCICRAGFQGPACAETGEVVPQRLLWARPLHRWQLPMR